MTRVPESSTSIPFVTPNGTRCTTYVKVIGDLGCGKPPVIAIHGGPGGGHEYLLPFAALWNRHGIPVIFYDQIGCGGSSRVSEYDGDKSFWTVELFMSELDNLIDHFKLQDGPGYDVLGQSWGAMMAAMLATKRPKGLRRVILASGVADMDLSVKGYNLCIKLLSTEHQKAIDEAVASGDYTAANYKAAMDAFHRAFLCRSEVFPPPELIPALQHLTETKVWSTMLGKSLFEPSEGVLNHWTVIPDLHKIDVPVLVYNGEYDCSHDVCTVPFFEKIPKVRWYTFADSAHMVHLENEARREKCLTMVGSFLTVG